jgi:hypothetical protein
VEQIILLAFANQAVIDPNVGEHCPLTPKTAKDWTFGGTTSHLAGAHQ